MHGMHSAGCMRAMLSVGDMQPQVLGLQSAVGMQLSVVVYHAISKWHMHSMQSIVGMQLVAGMHDSVIDMYGMQISS